MRRLLVGSVLLLAACEPPVRELEKRELWVTLPARAVPDGATRAAVDVADLAGARLRGAGGHRLL